VRVRHVQDFGRRAGGDEFLHHLAAQVARVADLAVELAVGKGAGTAFAELHVAFRVELLLAPQAPGVLGAFAHGLAALQHDGLEPHLRQHQRRQHAAGAKAHHHRALTLKLPKIGRGLRDEAVGHVRGRSDVRVLVKARQQGGLVDAGGQRDIDDVDRQQLGLARVEAAFEDGELGNGLGGNAQRLGGQPGQRGNRVGHRGAVGLGFTGGIGGAAVFHRQGGQGKFEFGQSHHGYGSW